MALALLTMSGKELDWVEWMQRIRERRVRQAQIATLLGLCPRQVERLYSADRRGGAAALISKERGSPGPRRLPLRLREQVLGFARERYQDFGPTLAHENLPISHGIRLSVETLR
jgi:hypothetical protein